MKTFLNLKVKLSQICSCTILTLHPIFNKPFHFKQKCLINVLSNDVKTQLIQDKNSFVIINLEGYHNSKFAGALYFSYEYRVQNNYNYPKEIKDINSNIARKNYLEFLINEFTGPSLNLPEHICAVINPLFNYKIKTCGHNLDALNLLPQIIIMPYINIDVFNV